MQAKWSSTDDPGLFPRAAAVATSAFAAIMLSAAPAHAICAPASGNNVTATCTGTTNNQDGLEGYGRINQTNLNTTVVQGATVSGTDNGINFNTGSVTNAGAVTGTTASGIFANTPAGTGTITVSNSGRITGANYGINTFTDLAVTNSGNITGIAAWGVDFFSGAVNVTNTSTGTISGGGFGGGIVAGTSATVANSGSVAGGIYATTSANVTNSGSVTGGINAGTGATVANSGSITDGVYATTSAYVTNSGSVTGGIAADNLTVTNTIAGTIDGINANTSATVTNSGSVTGGINAGTAAYVTNSGLITGGTAGIQAGSSATIANSGTIAGTGPTGIGILTGTTANVANSGTIIGAGGTAIQFNANGTPGSDILTVLPGARFGGKIDFGGGADTINFASGSWILNTANFNKMLSTVTTPGAPYLVTSNQIVVADVSGFGAQNRAIMDITWWINSVLPDAPVFAPAASGGANSFAAAASPFDAFASFPPDAPGNAATSAPVLKTASVTYADGNTVWTRGFGGQRQQDTSGAFAGSTTTGYGGASGYERVLDPDLKIGALLGASTNKTNLYQNAGSVGTDTVFGGAYGRLTRGSTFLDLAVIGGNLDNSSARTIAGGLAPQIATAAYGGWFVDPAMMLGQRIDIDQRGFTVTPALRVRYVAAHFDGYTETGSTANLTIDGRDFQAWEERAEITFANTRMIGASRVTARVTGGFLGDQRSTGGQLNIALLDQNFLAATPDRGSIAGGYGSARIDWQIGRVTLFAAGEATYTNDATKIYAGKGGARVAW